MKLGQKKSGGHTVKSERLSNYAQFHAAGKATYAYDRPAGDFSGQAKVGREFVYVLNFNVPGMVGKPFYVGQTADLHKRLLKHRYATWHVNRFNKPVKVSIVGTVPETLVRIATQDLTNRLLRHGFLLKNALPDRSGYMGRKTYDQLDAYLKSIPNPEEIFDQWRVYWAQQEAASRVPTVVQRAEDIIITQPDVMHFIRTRHYVNVWATRFSQRLATAYDPRLQGALLRIPYANNLKTRQQAQKQLRANIAALNGDWYITDRLIPDTTVLFKLGPQLQRGIEAHKTVSFTPGQANMRKSKYTVEEIAAVIARENLNQVQLAAAVRVLQWFDYADQNANVPTGILPADVVALTAGIWVGGVLERNGLRFMLANAVKKQLALLRLNRTSGTLSALQPYLNAAIEPSVVITKKTLLKNLPNDVGSLSTHRLAKKLAHGWDEDRQSSIIILSATKNVTGVAVMQDMVLDVATLSDYWFTNDDIQFNESLEFFLRSKYRKSSIQRQNLM